MKHNLQYYVKGTKAIPVQTKLERSKTIFDFSQCIPNAA